MHQHKSASWILLTLLIALMVAGRAAVTCFESPRRVSTLEIPGRSEMALPRQEKLPSSATWPHELKADAPEGSVM